MNKSAGEEHNHQDDQKSADDGDEGGIVVEELDVLEEHTVYAEYYERAPYGAPNRLGATYDDRTKDVQ